MSRGLKLDRGGRIKLTEADVESQVIGRVCADGWTAIKTDVGIDVNSGRLINQVGMTDYLLLKRSLYIGRPHTVFLELKRPYATPEPHQLAWMDGMRKRGFHCEWVDSYQDGGNRPLLSLYAHGQFYLTGEGPSVA